jgi:hypothetical protein
MAGLLGEYFSENGYLAIGRLVIVEYTGIEKKFQSAQGYGFSLMSREPPQSTRLKTTTIGMLQPRLHSHANSRLNCLASCSLPAYDVVQFFTAEHN